MTQIEKVATELMEMHLRGDLSVSHIKERVGWLWDDATKLVKNINETSAGETDRINRIIQFEEKFGLSKTHLLNN